MMKINLGYVQKTKPYSFADTLEIKCVFEKLPVSQSDALTLFNNGGKAAEDLTNVGEVDIDDDNMKDDPDGYSGANKTQDIQQHIDECFRQLEYRFNTFGDDYPFEVSADTIKLRTATANLTERQKLYLFLLLASQTRIFKKECVQKIADFFELVCKYALKGMMNESAEVYMFGPNSCDRKTHFHSNLQEAIPKLAKFMGMELTTRWDQNLPTKGDAGIDIVGVQKLEEDEGEGGWNVFLAQCAARELPDSWEKKRYEANIDYKKHLFYYSVCPQAVFFIPSCFRQPNGVWSDIRYVSNVILMDRVRLMKIIDNNSSDLFQALSSFMDEMFKI